MACRLIGTKAIIWTSDGTLLIRNLGRNISEILKRNSYIFVQENSFVNVVCEIAAILPRPQCLDIPVIDAHMYSQEMDQHISYFLYRIWLSIIHKLKQMCHYRFVAFIGKLSALYLCRDVSSDLLPSGEAVECVYILTKHSIDGCIKYLRTCVKLNYRHNISWLNGLFHGRLELHIWYIP